MTWESVEIVKSLVILVNSAYIYSVYNVYSVVSAESVYNLVKLV